MRPGARVCCWVRARRSPNRRLIDKYHTTDVLSAGNRGDMLGLAFTLCEPRRHILMQNIVEESGLSRARDTRNAYELSKRHINVLIL